jgi:restriction endonuclease Mrr
LYKPLKRERAKRLVDILRLNVELQMKSSSIEEISILLKIYEGNVMGINKPFHYPPELMILLNDTIPLLNRKKIEVFLFFEGAGVPTKLMQSLRQQWQQDKSSITKYDITQQVLTKLNQDDEKYITERREIIKRVVQFESFLSCWPEDQFKARGLVAEIQKVVNVKDTFTRIAQERESEQKSRIAQKQAEIEKISKKKEEIAKVKSELFSLFAEKNRQKRGKALEKVLNSLFQVYGILILEAFALTGDDGEGIVEQIDGVIEIDGHLYFIEMKWWEKPIGVPEISQHLVRIYHRAESRAIIISGSGFTGPAVTTCKDALQQKVVTLCTLQEFVILLEKEYDLCDFIKNKVQAAVTHRKPFVEFSSFD